MKRQTFIVRLEDEKKISIDFERFSDKRIETVMRKTIEFYKNLSNYDFFRKELDESSFLAVYETPDVNGNYIERARYNKAELMELLAIN